MINSLKRPFANNLAGRSLLLILMFFLFSNVSGQSLPEDSSSLESTSILFEFVKTEAELPKAGSYFNVLRIQNNQSESFVGELLLKVPDNWNLIASSSTTIELDPGEELLFPVRASMPPSTLGGISYMINAEIFGQENYYDYTSAYVSIVRHSYWDVYIPSSQIYLSEFKPHGDFRVELSNKGNASELIKLAFTTGALLEFVDPLEGDSIMFVDLPAFTDTVLAFDIREKRDISYAEKRAALQSWRSSSINLVASTTEKNRFSGIRVDPLVSSYIDEDMHRSYPLSIGLTMNNLLSTRTPKMTFRSYGKILFPDAQQLQYSLGVSNIYFDLDRMENTDFYQLMRYSLRYSDKNTSVAIADRLGVGQLHVLNGQGIRAQHSFGDQNTIYLNAMQNPLRKDVGVFTGYSKVIRGIEFNTGVTLETKTNVRGGHYTWHLGTKFKFLKYNTFRAQAITSVSKYSSDIYLQNDTSLLGFGYRVSYIFNNRSFRFSIDQFNTKNSYLRNAGINRINVRSEYVINDESRLDGLYYRNDFQALRYPYNLFFPASKNINDAGRLFYTRIRNSIIYQVGPEVSNSVRYYASGSSDLNSRYSYFQPGIFGSATFRLEAMRSITPSLQLGAMFVDYQTEDPRLVPYEINGVLKYKIGLSYYDQAFKLNTYFTSGEASDLYRSLVVDSDPIINQAFNVRPYYERYFNDEKIRTSAYLNYTYYIPSLRITTLMNVTADFYMKNGWNTYLSSFLYRSSRNDPELGRVTTSDLNFLLGIRKSFDIQQPRLKYYDLTIIGFDDLNGNGIREANEKPISNVLINIARDDNKNLKKNTGFNEIVLISDPNGEIYYHDIPEGIYDLSITPLTNLGDLYFLNGKNQTVEVAEDMFLYLPLVESYKVMGKVIMNRDPNSNEGRISLEGIRISAVGENGESYSTLTNSFGSFVLGLPKATSYDVSIYNVFGEQFQLERDRYTIQFTGNKSVNVDFIFNERHRQIRFNEGEQFFDFNIQREDE